MSHQRRSLCLAPACVMVSESTYLHLALGITDWVPAFQPCVAGLHAVAQGLDTCTCPVPGSLARLYGERFE